MLKVKYSDLVAEFMENICTFFCPWPNDQTVSVSGFGTRPVGVRGAWKRLKPFGSDAQHSSREEVRNGGTKYSLHIYPHGVMCT
jgi:hypothetical protein